MKTAAIATIALTSLLLSPAAALAGQKTTTTRTTPTSTTVTKTTTTPAETSTTRTPVSTRTTTTPSATTTTPASVPTTTITTPPGNSSTTLVLAPPRPANLLAGRAALTAYENYLQTLVGSEASSRANATAYVNTVESGCKSALEPLTQGADGVKPAVQNTLTVLGKEIGDDLAVNYDEVAEAPFGKLTSQLERLKWVAGGHNAQVIANYVTAETALISLPQSTLCQDVLLASTKPAQAPEATRAFLKQYSASVSAASAGLGGFLSLLHAYATASERPLVQRIAALAQQFARDSRADLLVSGQQLTTSLETS